jgi:hypothetical protein
VRSGDGPTEFSIQLGRLRAGDCRPGEPKTPRMAESLSFLRKSRRLLHGRAHTVFRRCREAAERRITSTGNPVSHSSRGFKWLRKAYNELYCVSAAHAGDLRMVVGSGSAAAARRGRPVSGGSILTLKACCRKVTHCRNGRWPPAPEQGRGGSGAPSRLRGYRRRRGGAEARGPINALPRHHTGKRGVDR